jgi:DNA mismatch endonuclease (patch repair protein)
MADVHSKETRSYNMSRIKGKNTKPEILVRKFLFSKGFRYRINVSKLPGKPDIVLPKYKTVIFIHGCFWHGHEGCRYFVVPKTRTEWWLEKISSNIERDTKVEEFLKANGWKVIVIFECKLKSGIAEETLQNLITFISYQQEKYE